jgi:hypothetical protein
MLIKMSFFSAYLGTIVTVYCNVQFHRYIFSWWVKLNNLNIFAIWIAHKWHINKLMNFLWLKYKYVNKNVLFFSMPRKKRQNVPYHRKRQRTPAKPLLTNENTTIAQELFKWWIRGNLKHFQWIVAHSVSFF